MCTKVSCSNQRSWRQRRVWRWNVTFQGRSKVRTSPGGKNSWNLVFDKLSFWQIAAPVEALFCVKVMKAHLIFREKSSVYLFRILVKSLEKHKWSQWVTEVISECLLCTQQKESLQTRSAEIKRGMRFRGILL